MDYANGEKYTGDWKDNMKNGQGKHFFNSQERNNTIMEINTMVTGKTTSRMEKVQIRTSVGLMEYSNGDAYNGDWQNNEKTGKGIAKHYSR